MSDKLKKHNTYTVEQGPQSNASQNQPVRACALLEYNPLIKMDGTVRQHESREQDESIKIVLEELASYYNRKILEWLSFVVVVEKLFCEDKIEAAKQSIGSLRENINDVIFYNKYLLGCTRSQKHSKSEDKNMEMREVLGKFAHELNNVLSFEAFFELLLMNYDSGDVEKAKSNLNSVREVIQRMRTYMRQILNYTRPGELPLQQIQVCMLMQVILKELYTKFLPENVEVVYKNRLPKDICINVVPSNIQQVLINLCLNSCHAMGNVGTISIEVDCEKLEKENYLGFSAGNYTKISVSDTGYGINPDNLKQVFDSFFTTKNRKEGTGLGLAVVKDIVKKHGGAITVKSKVDEGTTFTIYLPTKEESTLAYKGFSNLAN